MKHRSIAIIIALLSGASITLLLIPALLSNKQLWIIFFVSTTIIFLLVWIFNEFIIFRDYYKLDMLIRKLAEGKESGEIEHNLKMYQAQNLARDMTDYYSRKNTYLDELIKSSDLRRQFIADVSHELKSPLFSAQGYVLTLLDGADKDKNVRTKFLKKAARNLDYLDILVQDLLVLSQIESKAISMFEDHFDMVNLAKEVLEDREAKAAKAEISLKCMHEKSPLIVYGDYTRITQVLTNLVNNGINYNSPGGNVVVELQEKSEGILVSVVDTGDGIEPENHEKVFNRFFRVDKSRTVKKSTGLGLAIVKHILENHNVSIHLDSELGKGSTFSFLLPRDKKYTSASEDKF
ncbi:MAG: two-component sensor histidine kinase [Bacteroidetes bacterium]|nr:MAG: two-component sensor histidine kinase [Bacteroidota bacterium]